MIVLESRGNAWEELDPSAFDPGYDMVRLCQLAEEEERISILHALGVQKRLARGIDPDAGMLSVLLALAAYEERMSCYAWGRRVCVVSDHRIVCVTKIDPPECVVAAGCTATRGATRAVSVVFDVTCDRDMARIPVSRPIRRPYFARLRVTGRADAGVVYGRMLGILASSGAVPLLCVDDPALLPEASVRLPEYCAVIVRDIDVTDAKRASVRLGVPVVDAEARIPSDAVAGTGGIFRRTVGSAALRLCITRAFRRALSEL